MLYDQKFSRRAFVVGGASAAMVGCSPPTAQQGNGGDAPSLLEAAELFLTMMTVAAPIGGLFLGAIKLHRAAALFKQAGQYADNLGMAIDAVQLFNDNRSNFFGSAGSGALDKGFAVPQTANINAFDLLPIFMNNVSVQLGILNASGGNFGAYDIYATVKRVDERPPQSLVEMWGTGELPHAIISPPAEISYDGLFSVGSLPPGAFVSYSWRVPRGQTPTDEFIAGNALAGPAFLSIDQQDNTIELGEALHSRDNVQARYQIPSASV